MLHASTNIEVGRHQRRFSHCSVYACLRLCFNLDIREIGNGKPKLSSTLNAINMTVDSVDSSADNGAENIVKFAENHFQ